MNNFINKILKEAEDSSDDFFKSKLSGKRKKQFEEFQILRNDVLSKMNRGIKLIKVAYEHKLWRSKSEETFINIFRTLKTEKDLKGNDIYLNFCGLFDRDMCECYYDISTNELFVSTNVWSSFDMRYSKLERFMKTMFAKYFELTNIYSVDEM